MVPPTHPNSAEDCLSEALRAGNPQKRAKYATQGLACHRLQDDVQALLLRQLYLAHLERECLEDARAIAEQMVQVGTLEDVALRDLAVACIALGDTRAALLALRLAGRSAPVERRAVHLSALGALHYVRGQYELAAPVLRRALRWADGRSVLYGAQLTLVEHQLGEQTGAELSERLEALTALDGLFPTFLQAETLAALQEHDRAKVARERFIAQLARASALQRAGLAAEYRKVRADLA